MAKLRLIKLTPKQTHMMGELMVYFNGRRKWALQKRKANPEWCEPIPLTKIYAAHRCNARDRDAVKVAAAVFFKQVTRGNNMTGKCSTWAPLKTPHLNEQIKKVLNELYKDNMEHQHAIRTFYNTPKDDPTVVTITTEFKFKNKEQAAMFAELMQQVEIDEAVE